MTRDMNNVNSREACHLLGNTGVGKVVGVSHENGRKRSERKEHSPVRAYREGV